MEKHQYIACGTSSCGTMPHCNFDDCECDRPPSADVHDVGENVTLHGTPLDAKVSSRSANSHMEAAIVRAEGERNTMVNEDDTSSHSTVVDSGEAPTGKLSADETAAKICSILNTCYPSIEWPFLTISSLIREALNATQSTQSSAASGNPERSPDSPASEPESAAPPKSLTVVHLRAALFDVIDEDSEGGSWRLYAHNYPDALMVTEDMVNAQRMDFVDTVIARARRLREVG